MQFNEKPAVRQAFFIIVVSFLVVCGGLSLISTAQMLLVARTPFGLAASIQNPPVYPGAQDVRTEKAYITDRIQKVGVFYVPERTVSFYTSASLQEVIAFYK